MKIWKISENVKPEETESSEGYLYHGGYDFGDDPELKSGHQNGKPTGRDSGALFLTPSETYARQYMKHPKGLYRTKLPIGEKIFDIEDPVCHEQFIEGSKKWEDYSSVDSARRDARRMLDSMVSSSEHGAVDWATASQYIDEMIQSGFTGAKFLERPAEKIRMRDDGSYELSGPPVYSYALFRDKLPVERVL